MGGGDHAPYKVPSASIYKVEDVPQLLETQQALARRGLKDPWLRNEVWRYNKKEFGTHRTRLVTFMFRGFLLGLGACVATIGAEHLFGIDYTGGRHHEGGHGDGHGDGQHH